MFFTYTVSRSMFDRNIYRIDIFVETRKLNAAVEYNAATRQFTYQIPATKQRYPGWGHHDYKYACQCAEAHFTENFSEKIA